MFCNCPPGSNCLTIDCVCCKNWVECTDFCPAGESCRNKRIKRGEVKAVDVKDSKIHGKGLFALETIRKEDYIMEYTGILRTEMKETDNNQYIVSVREWGIGFE